MARLKHVWTQVGFNMCSLLLCGGICRPTWAQDSPTWGHGIARPPLFASASYSFGVRRRIYRGVWTLSPAAATFCQRYSTTFLHGDLASVGTLSGETQIQVTQSHDRKTLHNRWTGKKEWPCVWQAKKVKGWQQLLGFLPQVAWTAVGRSLSQRRRNWFLQWLARWAGKLVAKTAQPKHNQSFPVVPPSGICHLSTWGEGSYHWRAHCPCRGSAWKQEPSCTKAGGFCQLNKTKGSIMLNSIPSIFPLVGLFTLFTQRSIVMLMWSSRHARQRLQNLEELLIGSSSGTTYAALSKNLSASHNVWPSNAIMFGHVFDDMSVVCI